MSRARRFLVGSNPKRTLTRIAILAFASAVTFGWLLTPVRVHGISMEPTYRDGRFTLVNRVVYRFRPPARGDVVAIRLAGPHVLYVKRIVGLPHERLAIVGGVVHIDGLALTEPYVRQRQPWSYGEIVIGAGEYFVIGDNRAMRAGDHDFGRVDARRIVGRLLF